MEQKSAEQYFLSCQGFPGSSQDQAGVNGADTSVGGGRHSPAPPWVGTGVQKGANSVLGFKSGSKPVFKKVYKKYKLP